MADVLAGCAFCAMQLKSCQKVEWCASGCLSVAHAECVDRVGRAQLEFRCPGCEEEAKKPEFSGRLDPNVIFELYSKLREVLLPTLWAVGESEARIKSMTDQMRGLEYRLEQAEDGVAPAAKPNACGSAKQRRKRRRVERQPPSPRAEHDRVTDPPSSPRAGCKRKATEISFQSTSSASPARVATPLPPSADVCGSQPAPEGNANSTARRRN